MLSDRTDEENVPLLSPQRHRSYSSAHSGTGGGSDGSIADTNCGTGRVPFQSHWARFRQPSETWIVTIFPIYALIFGILAVPELNSALALICHQRYPSREISLHHSVNQTTDLFKELNYCLGNENAQTLLSQFLIYRQLVPGLLGAISIPVLSSLSDRIGRRPILSCAAIGPLIKEAIFLILLWYPDSVDYQWLLLGYAIEGLSGEVIVAMAASQAYITDLVPPSDRAKLFSYIQAGAFLSMGLGPVISGIVLTASGSFEIIYSVALCSHLLLALIFRYILPESKQNQSSTTTGKSSATDETSSKQTLGESGVKLVLSSFKTIRSLSSSRQLNMAILAFADFIVFGVLISINSLQLAYQAYLFHWTPATQSFVMALVSSWSILVLIVLFPVAMTLLCRLGRRVRHASPSILEFGEMGAIKICMMLLSVGYLGMAFARTPDAFIIASMVVASAAPAIPLLTSCLTAHMPSHQSGQLLGILSFFHAISRIVMPAMMNATYSRTVSLLPAPLFILLGVIHGVSLITTLGVKADVT